MNPATHREIAAKISGIYAKDPKVRIEACAVADREGEATFHVTRDDQSSSIHAPTDAYANDRPGDGVVRTETVPLKRLETLLDGCAGPMLFKVDVHTAAIASDSGELILQLIGVAEDPFPV